MEKTTKGYLLMFGFAFFAMLAYLTLDYTFRNYPEVDAQNAIFWGFIGGSLLVTPFKLSHAKFRKNLKKTTQNHGKLLLAIAFITTIGALLWFQSVKMAGSGFVALLSQSEVLWAFFLGIIFLKEKISVKEFIGIFLAIWGIFFISTLEGKSSLFAAALVLSSKLFYAGQSFLVKKYGKDLETFSFTYVRAILLSIIIGIFISIQKELSIFPLPALFLLALSQVFGIFLGRYCYFEAHKLLPISKLNVFLFLEPVLVLIGGYILFGDTVSGQKLLGATLIIGGLLFFVHEQVKLKKEK